MNPELIVKAALDIGAAMLLIPGIALIKLLTRLLTGDIVSGFLKLLNSMLLAFSVAMGFAHNDISSLYISAGIAVEILIVTSIIYILNSFKKH